MRCPFCGYDSSQVVETRDCEAALRRRRECERCNKRFTTYERAEEWELVVLKKDGRREKFDREKLKRGLVRAAEKRPVSTDLIDSLVEEIEMELRTKGQKEVNSRSIGNSVLKKLKRIDKITYVRFASVYMDFENLEDFEEIIEKLT